MCKVCDIKGEVSEVEMCACKGLFLSHDNFIIYKLS